MDGEHDEQAPEERDPTLGAARPDTGDATDQDDEDDVVIPAGRNTGISLLLGITGMILIPIGLIVMFLAITRGDRVQGQSTNTLTAQTVVPGAFTPSLTSLAGRWAIVGGPDSWVGYSVGERFLSVDTPSSAEGRTTSIDGGIVLGPAGLEAVAINAKLSELKSDDAKRDETLRTRGLETDRFPNATFAVAEPVALGRVPPVGEHIEVTVKGELTLHGVTKPIELRAQVQVLAGDTPVIEVVANHAITFSDYGIEAPNVANIVSVQDKGELRIHLRFARVPNEVGGVSPRPTTSPGSVPGTTRP